MAKILYGVHGTGHGHAIRALTVARHYPQHKFLFVSHGDGAQLLRLNVPLLECPNPATPVRAHQVMALATLWKALRHLRNARHWFRVVKKAAEEFQPDVTITDYEYFTPRIARLFGIPSLSLDNQHAITQGRLSFPLRQSFSWAATSFAIRALFSQTDRYLISCFFQPPHRNRPHIQWVAPLLREEILRMSPNPGHHVVAYQGYSTFPGFTETLRSLNRPVHAYGLGDKPPEGAMRFRSFNEQDFIQDLAGCAYVICGGGHTLISEALYLGKPVLSIPVHGAFEQYLNAHYVELCGYGKRVATADFHPDLLRNFDQNLEGYRAEIKRGNFCGNREIFSMLDEFIEGNLI